MTAFRLLPLLLFVPLLSCSPAPGETPRSVHGRITLEANNRPPSIHKGRPGVD